MAVPYKFSDSNAATLNYDAEYEDYLREQTRLRKEHEKELEDRMKKYDEEAAVRKKEFAANLRQVTRLSGNPNKFAYGFKGEPLKIEKPRLRDLRNDPTKYSIPDECERQLKLPFEPNRELLTEKELKKRAFMEKFNKIFGRRGEHAMITTTTSESPDKSIENNAKATGRKDPEQSNSRSKEGEEAQKDLEKKEELFESKMEPQDLLNTVGQNFVKLLKPSSGVTVKIHVKQDKSIEKSAPPRRFILEATKDGELNKRVNLQDYKSQVSKLSSRRQKIIENLARKHRAYQEYFANYPDFERILQELDRNENPEGGGAPTILKELREYNNYHMFALPNARFGKGQRRGSYSPELDPDSPNRVFVTNQRKLSLIGKNEKKKMMTPRPDEELPVQLFQQIASKDKKKQAHVINFNTDRKLMAELLGEKGTSTLLVQTFRQMKAESRPREPRTARPSTVVRLRRSADEIELDLSKVRGYSPQPVTQSARELNTSNQKLPEPKKPTELDRRSTLGARPLTRQRSAAGRLEMRGRDTHVFIT